MIAPVPTMPKTRSSATATDKLFATIKKDADGRIYSQQGVLCVQTRKIRSTEGNLEVRRFMYNSSACSSSQRTQPFPCSYGVRLNAAEDVAFVNDRMHLSYVMPNWQLHLLRIANLVYKIWNRQIFPASYKMCRAFSLLASNFSPHCSDLK